MNPKTKPWLYGQVPVILFVITVLSWLVHIPYTIANRHPYPSYPSAEGLGIIVTLALFTLLAGILAFLLSIVGLRSPNVSKTWARAGLILNAPVVLYVVGFYPVTFVYRLFSTSP